MGFAENMLALEFPAVANLLSDLDPPPSAV
jgi:hypothetical protein